MSQKKPIWTTVEAHQRLKDYCSATGKTQLDVVSELILSHLDPAGAADAEASTPQKTANAGRHFGGVWVV